MLWFALDDKTFWLPVFKLRFILKRMAQMPIGKITLAFKV